MRSRTLREGSVGLLILLGVGLFAGLALWLRGASLGKKSYTLILEFANAGGMQVGAPVRYRGVDVGKIASIDPAGNGVDVKVEITSVDLLIPRDVIVEANQQGLIGAAYIDIRPRNPLPTGVRFANALDPNCNQQLIACNKARLPGETGISFDRLIRSTLTITELYSDPEFYKNITAATKNASEAAAGITKLTNQLTVLSQSAQKNINSLSVAANSVTRSASQTSNQIAIAANKLGNTASQFGVLSNQLGSTNNEYRLTATQLNKLVGNLNNLVVENRSTLVTTLNNLSEASAQLRGSVVGLGPTFNQLNATATRLNSAKLLNNLEALSANTAQASANLRDLSNNLNNPTTLVKLQQTLDSARITFSNAQKITADVDRLTGNPAFVENVEKLVNGLSKLVSSTQQLEQQVEVAKTLAPVEATLTNEINSQVTANKVLPSTISKQETSDLSKNSFVQNFKIDAVKTLPVNSAVSKQNLNPISRDLPNLNLSLEGKTNSQNSLLPKIGISDAKVLEINPSNSIEIASKLHDNQLSFNTNATLIPTQKYPNHQFALQITSPPQMELKILLETPPQLANKK